MSHREKKKDFSLRVGLPAKNLHDNPCGIVESDGEEEVYRVTC